MKLKVNLIIISLFVLIVPQFCVRKTETAFGFETTIFSPVLPQNNAVTARIDFFCKDQIFIYCDKVLSEPDFTVKSNFHERRINATFSEKIKFVEQNIRLGASVKNALLYTFPLLETTVNQILQKIKIEPINAKIHFYPHQNKKFLIENHKDGARADEDKIYYSIFTGLRKNHAVKINVETVSVPAAITAQKLSEQTYLRGEFSTNFSTSNNNRKHNIKLALSKINGTIVEDGKTFSFNKTVGERTESNGFCESKIIMDGEYVDGIGGGVCQTSSTVYNCALLSGLEIQKARAHSLPPSYVEPSFDAMVNSSGSDLSFINRTGAPVYIYASGENDRATIKIYGLKNEYKIVRESKTVSVSPTPNDKIIEDKDNEYGTANLLEGEQKRVSYGCGSVVSEGYLCYYKNGTLIEKKLIRKDAYRALRGVVAIKPKN